jgi:hypothetical protein
VPVDPDPDFEPVDGGCSVTGAGAGVTSGQATVEPLATAVPLTTPVPVTSAGLFTVATVVVGTDPSTFEGGDVTGRGEIMAGGETMTGTGGVGATGVDAGRVTVVVADPGAPTNWSVPRTSYGP